MNKNKSQKNNIKPQSKVSNLASKLRRNLQAGLAKKYPERFGHLVARKRVIEYKKTI